MPLLLELACCKRFQRIHFAVAATRTNLKLFAYKTLQVVAYSSCFIETLFVFSIESETTTKQQALPLEYSVNRPASCPIPTLHRG